MALAYDGAIQRLIDAFGRLPGIGPKGAQRIAFYMLSAPEDEARDLAEAIEEVKAAVLERVLAAGCAELEPEEAAELAVSRAVELLAGNLKGCLSAEDLTHCARKIRAHTRA